MSAPRPNIENLLIEHTSAAQEFAAGIIPGIDLVASDYSKSRKILYYIFRHRHNTDMYVVVMYKIGIGKDLWLFEGKPSLQDMAVKMAEFDSRYQEI